MKLKLKLMVTSMIEGKSSLVNVGRSSSLLPMDILKIVEKVGQFPGKLFLYSAYSCIGLGFIWMFFIAPAVMMSTRFGWGWGVAWMSVLPFLAYIGRNMWLPAKWRRQN